MSQRRLRSEFIITEPPKERTRRRFRRVGIVAMLVFAGIVACSYVNYNNQVLGQQIDIANHAIITLHRLQASKEVRLNVETKYDVIQRKAAALGFTSTTLTTDVLTAPTNQFDPRSLAIYARRHTSEHENFVPLFTQRITKISNDHN